MIQAIGISKKYSGNPVLNELNFSAVAGERVGLVGSNGSGKSTFLGILAGTVKPDSGKVVIKNSVDVGFVPQQANPGSRLSGGQQVKNLIEKALSQNPQVLLLDEPTNNLDLESLNWLENILLSFKGLVIFTSHDRFFMDKVCTRIVELSSGKLKEYGGNYTFYKAQKQKEAEIYAKIYHEQQKFIKKTVDQISSSKQEAQHFETKFSSRQPYEKKKSSKSVRGAIVRQGRLEKLLDSTLKIEKPVYRKNYNPQVVGLNAAGKMILQVKDLSFNFAGREIFNKITLYIFGKDRVWINGKNGSGKTTLLKNIIGQLSPTQGSVKFGAEIKYAYYSQDNSNIDLSLTGIKNLLQTCPDETECFRMATRLHLTYEDLLKPAQQLSGGQKAKLEFSKLLLGNFNLLILDEPTNNLEIETREDIEDALVDFEGAILFVSHDRFFVEKLKPDSVVNL